MAGGSSGADDHSGSVFRVGDNVELWRVIGMVSVLLVFVMLFENLIHKLEHYLKKYPKYHDMMTKVFGELMILGLIGLGIKILKEVAHLDAYSPRMVAFQAADLTIFLVAIALIIQATVVFLRMRRKNIQCDKADLMSTQHLVDHIAHHAAPTWTDHIASGFRKSKTNATILQPSDVPEVATMRILRHFFLRRYGLPELFPFSKYLRQAQDNQISHMIEVEMSTWIILLLIAWALDVTADAIAHTFLVDSQFHIVVAFLLFTWLSVVFNAAITAYFTWAIDELLTAAVDGESHRANRYLYLNEIAEHEAHVSQQELATDAIAVMERVREEEGTKKIKRNRRYLTKHDTGFQLVSTLFRKVSSKTRHKTTNHAGASTAKPTATTTPGLQQQQQQLHPNTQTQQQHPVKWFSRKMWHFVVMSSLMLNALYIALFCQCVIYQLQPIYEKVGLAPMWLLPLPMLINMFIFQPRILRNFILVSSICRVDDTALGDVIDHFTETIQLRANFVQTVHGFLEETSQTIMDVQAEFESHDHENAGFLDVEEVRLVLRKFGFKLSFFRFNSVAKLLFNFSGFMIEYSQVIKLLALAQSDELRSLYSHGHSQRDSRQSQAAMGRGVAHHGHQDDDDQLNASFVLMDNNSLYGHPSPYVPPHHQQPRSGNTGAGNATFLRAKSSAAASLYHLDFDYTTGEPRANHHHHRPNDQLQSPHSTHYMLI